MHQQHIVTHPDAVRRSHANWVIHVDLGGHGMPGALEQLWVHQLGPRAFEVCCLPFFSYGIALGDIVETQGTAPPDLVVASTIQRSGHRVLRVALPGYQGDPTLHELLHGAVLRCGLSLEWHRPEYKDAETGVARPMSTDLAHVAFRDFAEGDDCVEARAAHV